MRPAAFCGVVGFKPTYDWIPWRQCRDFAPTLDVTGGFTRSVQDMILLMRGLTGKTEFDPEVRLDGAVSIGLYRTSDWPKAPAYVHRVYEETAEYLSKAGCAVRDVTLPAPYDQLREVLEIVQIYESARSFEWELKCRRDALEPGLIKLLEDGWAIPRERYLWAIAAGEACRRSFADDVGDVDVLMVPGAAMEAPKISYVGSNDFIDMWMLLYVPDVALPVGKGPSGLPMGVQLIGRQGDDARHLVRARRIEEILRQRE
jgi:Asp-tRNA(Asn)/Glu-tRNA(Gln) amidotransferase A subunit family amidase